jgi:hypothetical protein
MKTFYLSRTLWINAIAVAALIVQSKFGFIISAEEQIAVLAIINLIIRALTKEELSLSKEK